MYTPFRNLVLETQKKEMGGLESMIFHVHFGGSTVRSGAVSDKSPCRSHATGGDGGTASHFPVAADFGDFAIHWIYPPT